MTDTENFNNGEKAKPCKYNRCQRDKGQQKPSAILFGIGEAVLHIFFHNHHSIKSP